VSRLVLFLGTGTSVGKTYVAERVLRALGGQGRGALGYKPVESGVTPGEDTDIARLERASTFHVKPPLRSQTFSAPVSPHVASRIEGREVDLAEIRREIARGLAAGPELFLLELPGGAFSPLTDDLSGAAFARSLPGVRVILVAMNRLGVLHEVGATTRACAALGLPIHGIVLNEAATTDASVVTNLQEIPRVTTVPVLASIRRQVATAPISREDPARHLGSLLAGEGLDARQQTATRA
jgi:dethiobiotin synthetase